MLTPEQIKEIFYEADCRCWYDASPSAAEMIARAIERECATPPTEWMPATYAQYFGQKHPGDLHQELLSAYAEIERLKAAAPAASAVHVTTEDIAKSGGSLAFAYANKIVADKLASAASAGQDDHERQRMLRQLDFKIEDCQDGLTRISRDTLLRARALIAARPSSPVYDKSVVKRLATQIGLIPASPVESGAPVDYEGVVSICEAHGIVLPVDCIEMVVEIIRLAAPQAGASSGGGASVKEGARNSMCRG